MAYPIAWSIKGIDEEAKAIAKRAAADAGVTMGAWLEAAIFSVAKAGLTKNQKPQPQATPMQAAPMPVPPPVPGLSPMASTPHGDVVEKRFFNTTIRLASNAINPNLTPALAEELNRMQQRLDDHFASVQFRVDDLELRLTQMIQNLPAASTTSLPAPAASASAEIAPDIAAPSVPEKMELSTQYSASYAAPMPNVSADAEQSVFAPRNLLRLALIVALALATFLIGQRLGADLFR